MLAAIDALLCRDVHAEGQEHEHEQGIGFEGASSFIQFDSDDDIEVDSLASSEASSEDEQ